MDLGSSPLENGSKSRNPKRSLSITKITTRFAGDTEREEGDEINQADNPTKVRRLSVTA